MSIQAGRKGPCAAGAELRGRLGKREDRVDVEAILRQRGQAGELLVEVRQVLGQNEAEMPAGKRNRLVVGKIAQHGHAAFPLDDRCHLVGKCGARVVEHDARHMTGRAHGDKAERLCGKRGTCPARVEHKQDRRLGNTGNVPGTGLGCCSHAVVVPHGTLDAGDIAAAPGVGEKVAHEGLGLKERVEIEAAHGTQPFMEGGVHIVGAALACQHAQATLAQRPHERAGECRLARAAFGRRDEDARQRCQHEAPPSRTPWPLMIHTGFWAAMRCNPLSSRAFATLSCTTSTLAMSCA